MKLLKRIAVLISLAAPAAFEANGGDIQSLSSIEASVMQFVQAQHAGDTSLEMAVQKLDNRLRLPVCANPLQVLWSPGSGTTGRVTVSVSCDTPKPWRVHVQGEVSKQAKVWVLNRGVQRGDALSADMLAEQFVTLGRDSARAARAGTPVQSIEPWVGYEFANAAGPGSLLTERMLVPRTLVNKGDTVRIRTYRKGLSIETKGTSLGSGAFDQRVQIRNSSSGKVLEAVVSDRGVVDILN